MLICITQFVDLGISPPAALIPVGNYNGLNWSSFLLVTPTPNGLVIKPQPSNPNLAGYGLYDQILAGGNKLTPLKSGATFDLQSFYFACVLTTAETAISTPQTCTVTATGYSGSKVVGTQKFNFKPTGALTTKMQFEKVGLWGEGLTQVKFSTANNALIATLFDDVQYTLYN